MMIQKDRALVDATWFGTGGAARYYVQPKSYEELVIAHDFAKNNKLPIFIIGEGANILISDEGIDGLVVRPSMHNLTINTSEGLVTAGAGISMSDLIERTLEVKLGGLEEFSGIPGSVGGSVYINIHYFEFLLSQFFVGGHVFNVVTGEYRWEPASWFLFGYNQSRLQTEPWLLLDATFALKPLTEWQAAFAQGRRYEIIRQRARRYPPARTCGSFFRNFLPEEIPFEVNGKKIPFVAYYLEQVGVKGALKINKASVFALHANMIVTELGAQSQDVIELARRMQELVFERYGLVLEPECQFIGFKKYPLHTQVTLRTSPLCSTSFD